RAMAMKTPEEAAAYLRAEEQRRLREIRAIVITSVNNVPVRVGDIVEGGPLLYEDAPSVEGVVVGHMSRLGRVSLDRPSDPASNDQWERFPEKIQGIILMRKGEKSLPALQAVKAKVDEINPDPETGRRGRLLPGVVLDKYYDRTDLVQATTRTVEHN